MINSNPSFDFSKFLLLEQAMKAGKTTIKQFVFTFDDAGIFVFADSNNTAKITVVSIMPPS